METSGLKCDNPDCGYADKTVLRSEYEKYINYPCPKCGRPILTQADYDALICLEKLEKNPIVKFLSKFFPNKEYSMEFNGKGFKSLVIKKVEK